MTQDVPVFARIVVPIDGTTPSHRAAELAIRLAARLSALIEFCTVVEGPDDVARAETSLAIEATKAEHAGVAFRTRFLQGKVAHRIVEFATDIEADPIVIGTHGRSGLDKLALGSVTEAVLLQVQFRFSSCANPESRERSMMPSTRMRFTMRCGDRSDVGHERDLRHRS